MTAARLLPFVLLATASLAFAQEPFSCDSAHKLTAEIVALGPARRVQPLPGRCTR